MKKFHLWTIVPFFIREARRLRWDVGLLNKWVKMSEPISEALPQTTKPIHPALQKRERRLYVHICTQDVCVRLRKKGGRVKVFWMSGIHAGNQEGIFQGRFTHDFREINYEKDADLLNYISQKENRFNRMGKTVKLRLRGGDEEQKPETNTKEPLTKKE